MIQMILRGNVVIVIGGCTCSACRRRAELVRLCAALAPLLGDRTAPGALKMLALADEFDRRLAVAAGTWRRRTRPSSCGTLSGGSSADRR